MVKDGEDLTTIQTTNLKNLVLTSQEAKALAQLVEAICCCNCRETKATKEESGFLGKRYATESDSALDKYISSL